MQDVGSPLEPRSLAPTTPQNFCAAFALLASAATSEKRLHQSATSDRINEFVDLPGGRPEPPLLSLASERVMGGRVKRKQAMREAEERTARANGPEPSVCALCQRLLGSRVEWHHPVPKSEGGNQTVPVHPICHRAIHAHVSNHELADKYADIDVLRRREDMQRFLRWIANKPADFHAPTRRTQAVREKTD